MTVPRKRFYAQTRDMGYRCVSELAGFGVRTDVHMSMPYELAISQDTMSAASHMLDKNMS